MTALLVIAILLNNLLWMAFIILTYPKKEKLVIRKVAMPEVNFDIPNLIPSKEPEKKPEESNGDSDRNVVPLSEIPLKEVVASMTKPKEDKK